ncbi:hypothetical protein ACFRFQ_00775 [Rhodococcus sp. NPDC056743]|uniref:hypothetical protein n=1 Tax=Rhodococcus sp. NPDC056743 TaxID=3345934 RepID=UPI00366C2736
MKKTIVGFIGACSLTALVACGSDGGTPTEVGTLTSTAPATATEGTATEGTATEGTATEGAPAAGLPRTYEQACNDVLKFLDGYQQAIDESGDDIGLTRESLANDMLTSIQAYPEWSTLSADEQAEVTRGFSAAVAGSC